MEVQVCLNDNFLIISMHAAMTATLKNMCVFFNVSLPHGALGKPVSL